MRREKEEKYTTRHLPQRRAAMKVKRERGEDSGEGRGKGKGEWAMDER